MLGICEFSAVSDAFSTHAALSVPRGWAFENLAHRHLTFLTPTEVYLPPLQELTHTADVKYVSQDSAPRGFLPIWRRKVVFYDAVSEVICNFENYYLRGAPTTHYLTLCSLDRISPPRKTSIFLYPPTSICTFSRCQSPRVYGGSEKGVDIISQILQAYTGIEPIYVLVTPRDESRAWKMPTIGIIGAEGQYTPKPSRW